MGRIVIAVVLGRMPSGVPQVIVNVEGQPVYLAQFDPAIGGARLQIGALDQPRPREVVLAAS